MASRWPGQPTLSLVSTAVKNPKFTFLLNTGLAGAPLTITANGTAVTFIAGSDFVLGTNDGPLGLAVTAGNLVNAILANGTLIPLGIIPRVTGAVVTLYPPPPVTSLILSTTAAKTICIATNSMLTLVKPAVTYSGGIYLDGDPTSASQGLFWPSTNDVTGTGMVTLYVGNLVSGHFYLNGLNDAVFAGSGGDYFAMVLIDSVGTADTFTWYVKTYSGFPSTGAPVSTVGSGAGLPITGGPIPLAGGITVQFGAKNGHVLGDQWTGTIIANNIVTRPGVAARGKIGAADVTTCIPVANDGIFLTCECDTKFLFQNMLVQSYGSHALVVRDAETLAVLYRKPLRYDFLGLAEWTGSGWRYVISADFTFTAPELFSFSANKEGLFFMHMYVTPTLTSAPTPYCGAEFGAPNPRKIAVISVDPVSYEPTIEEIITLDTVAGSTFAVATAP